MADAPPTDKAFLSAQLPPGAHNGLPTIVPQLLDQLRGGRRQPVYAVVQLTYGGANVDRHTDQLVPIARVLAIEPLLDDASADTARDLLREAYQRRTGAQDPLFEI